MPKYYCTNDDFRTILDAPDINIAMRKFLNHMIKNEQDCALISTVSEKGFSCNDAKLMTMIPLLKELDIDLPDDDVLLLHVCLNIGLNPNRISDKTKNWLLNGDDDGFIKN